MTPIVSLASPPPERMWIPPQEQMTTTLYPEINQHNTHVEKKIYI